MLEEWRPLLCPFDLSMLDAMGDFADFLPTVLPPCYHHLGFKYVHQL